MLYHSAAALAFTTVRRLANKTQNAIADEFGVTRTTWHRWEKEGGGPQIAAHLVAYAKACGVPMEAWEGGVSYENAAGDLVDDGIHICDFIPLMTIEGENHRFADAKMARDRLQDRVDAASRHVQGFPTGAHGLTHDDVKFAPAYQAAQYAYNAAFRQLRSFNEVFVRRFSEELRIERAAKRM